MKLHPLDWCIIAGYCGVALALGIYFSRRAGRSIDSFFIADRSLPWWLAGTSMVATTFAADTPLAVTGLVAANGVAGNWLWWNLAVSHVLAATVFARMWRRARVITDAELVELRYGGRGAAALRAIKAFYFALPINCITMGWVILAMAKVTGVLFDWPGWLAITICCVIATVYSMLGGFWGVVATDLIQFVMAMTGAIVLAVFAVQGAGGLDALQLRLDELYGEVEQIVAFLPSADSEWMPLNTFLLYIGVLWWTQKYADGGGYLMQRMAATKDESHAFKATLWFSLAHYALRPWPWILVGLCALVVYPKVAHPGMDRELAYPMMMTRYLPPGLLGLMVASFLAAFMSTIDTHLNWGASYLVGDLYRRFVRPNAPATHYVLISRLAVLLLMVLAGLLASIMGSIAEAWKFLIALGAGLGPVALARWFWWRVNAWSEIVAIAATALTVAVLYSGFTGEHSYEATILIIVAVSTPAWLLVTLLLPARREAAAEFYRRVRPPGLWGPVAPATTPAEPPPEANALSPHDTPPSRRGGLRLASSWLRGLVLVYGALFGIGELLLGSNLIGGTVLALTLAAGVTLIRMDS